MTRKQIPWLILGIFLSLLACQAGTAIAPTATLPATPSTEAFHATETPVLATDTPPPPTATPQPTPILPVLQPIGPNTLDSLTLLAQLGAGELLAVAWSPDGRFVAAATGSGLWILDGQTLQQTLFLPAPYPRRIAWSADGTWIASGNDENTPLQVWNVPGGQEQIAIPYAHGRIDDLTFNAQGELLVAGVKALDTSNINTYKLVTYLDCYDPQNGQQKTSVSLINPKNKALGLIPSYTQDAALLQTMAPKSDGSMDIAWWDSRTGQLLLEKNVPLTTALPLPTVGGRAVFFSRNNRSLVQVLDLKSAESTEIAFGENADRVGLDRTGALYVILDAELRLYDLQTGQVTQTLPAPSQNSLALGYFSPAYERMVLKEGATLTLRTVSGGELLASLPSFYERSDFPILSANAKTVLTQSGYPARNDVHIRLWDVDTLSERFEQPRSDYGAQPWLVIDRPQGGYWLARSGEVGLYALDEKGELSEMPEFGGAPIHVLASSQDGHVLMINNTIWDADSKTQRAEIPDITGFPTTWVAQPNADGSRVLFRDESYLLVWDVEAEKEIFHVLTEVREPTFSPTGKRLAFFNADEDTVSIWDVDAGQKIAEQTLAGRHLASQFSPDGRLLVVSVTDAGLYFLDAETGAVLRHLPEAGAMGLDWSAAGDLLVTSQYGVMRFWGIAAP